MFTYLLALRSTTQDSIRDRESMVVGSNGGGPSSPQCPGLQETWSQYSGFTERHPYLDLIATSHHIPDSVGTGEQWRRTLVQPVVIPNLEHTGIHSKFDEYEDDVMRPDGHVSREFKACIQKELRELPQLPLYYDDRDMKRRDRDHVCKHATSSTVPFHVGGRRWNDASALAQSRAHKLGSKNVGDSTTATADECSTVKPEPWTLGKRLVDPDKRLKKPYSHASLVKSLLDFNFTPPDKPLEWEVKGVTYILKA